MCVLMMRLMRCLLVHVSYRKHPHTRLPTGTPPALLVYYYDMA